MKQQKWINGATVLAGTSLVAIAFFANRPASAVPAFADQTDQPCAACHVGGFGPELTPFGREFKLGGYTLRTRASIPLALAAIASWTHTRKDQVPPPEHLSKNDNLVFDEASGFLAGGIGEHLGGYVQVTYDGVERHTSLDMLDLRAVTTAHLFGKDSILGISLNNAPLMEDAWNTSPIWGFPYTDSAVSETPEAAPLIDMLMGNVVGVSGYGWIGDKLYLGAGGYGSPSRGTIKFVGADPDMPGSIHGIAPYGRIAWQTNLAGGTFELGGNALKAAVYPMRMRAGGFTDHYTDFGIDSSWQKPFGSDTVSLNFRWEHEKGNLEASCALGLLGGDMDVPMSVPLMIDPGNIGCARYHLDTVRGTIGYSWHNKIGADLSVFGIGGTRNMNLYGGSGSPDSNGLTGQLDYTLWGNGHSPIGIRGNARIGLQYTVYGKFNGRRHNYDLMGANASDNDALRAFLWVAF